MSYGRSRLYDRGHVVERGDIALAPVSSRDDPVRSSSDASREIDTLRSINAHLIRQIAVLKQREAHALRLADRDGLTGLYNRRRMLELLDAAIDDASQQRRQVGLLFVDLDGFKAVNDKFGHAAGDRLLITIASRIAARARMADHVCRYGGDEFVVILPQVADLAAAQRVADSVRTRLSLPLHMDGAELSVTAAIGVSIYPDHARNAAELLHRADECMYRVKARGVDSPEWRSHPAPARRREDRFR